MILKLNIIKQYEKRLPGSKNCNSQEEVKRCFQIGGDVFHPQYLLEFCRKQTSSTGNEQRYKVKINPVFKKGTPFANLKK